MDLKNKPEDLLQRNPYGKVPVLEDGAGVIYESAIINEYLEERIDFLNSRVHPAASDLTHDREPDKARARMKQHLQTLENEMAGKKYLIGDQYSLADITYIPFYTRRERYQLVIDNNYPNLKRWSEALIARPQVAPTI